MMKHRRNGLFNVGIIAALWIGLGCSAAPTQKVFGEENNSGGAGGASSAPSGSSSTGGSGGGTDDDNGFGGFDGAGGTVMPPEDADEDGFKASEGDCNDNDRNVNPGAIEVIITEPDATGEVPEPADEDCDGVVDNVLGACDSNIAPADFDPIHGARAIDICAVATPADRKWGVLDAKYVRGDGGQATPTPAVGVLDTFGPNVHVQGGARMLVLSSGRARLPSYPGACNSESCSTYGPGIAPSGFPQNSPSCPPSANINDDVALELKLRVPTNATGYEFLFRFYTFEYPEWICNEFNDQFLALASPAPSGSLNGNISFDSMGNPVSVNIGFFDVCEGCPLGTSELDGTGFGLWNDAGATAWLRTRAPVTGGEELTLRFMIFDTGDDQLDSTALIDGFKWIANGGTVAVVTEPVDPN